MPRLEPVIWTKGSFLTPQHLQWNDRFLESSLSFQLEALTFRPWGFLRLGINHALLSTGTFALTQASGLLPDGLAFDMPNADTLPPPKPLSHAFGQDQTSLDIFLAVPEYREFGINVSTTRRKLDARFRSEIELIRDENTGLGEKPVEVAQKNFRLLTDGETREGTTNLRLARVVKTQAGSYATDARFVPPLLDLAASEYLMMVARRLVELLSARSSALSGLRRQRNQTLADFSAADIANFWLLYTINSWLPIFRHFYEKRRGHPELLWSAMLSMAGSLTTFSTTLHPRNLPVYDHDELGPTFTELDEKLRFLLETGVPRNVISLPLKLVQAAIYATPLADDKLFANTRMYLAISAETTEGDVIAKVPALVKICSASRIEQLVQLALPGVPLSHVSSPPAVIPIKLNYQYFSLAQSGPVWDTIVRGRNLSAYVPSDLPDPQLELVIVLPESKS